MSLKYIFSSITIGIVLVVSVYSFVLLNSVPLYETPSFQSVHGEVLDFEQVTELPARLVIPSLDIDVAVQHVGLAEDGSGQMAVPDNFTDVAWYQEGVRPGMNGSAVIAGHLNGKNVPKAVFFSLDTLVRGDELSVFGADGVEHVFRVVSIKTYKYDAPTEDVFLSTDERVRLNLITCGGEWLSGEGVYSERVVIFTEQIMRID